MKKKNAIVAVVMGLAMMTTTTMPVFAATSSVQGKLDRNLKHAQKWVERQTQKLLNRNDPTAAQVTAGLLKTYAKIQVWPKGLINPPSWGSSTPTPAYWQTGVKATPPSAWVGLKTVFPGKPSSEWPKLLGMTNAPTNKPITAATLAKWVLDWEIDAHKVNTAWEPTRDAFDLLRLYNFWYGTNLTKPTTVVNAHDLAAVENNIVEVSQGYRMLARNKVQLLMPMISHVGATAKSAYNGYFTRANWGQKALAPTVRGFDTTTFTFLKSGDVVFDYNTHEGLVSILTDAFVRNGVEVGNGGPSIGDIQGVADWRRSNPVPLRLRPGTGSFIGQKYNAVSAPNVGHNFFVAAFWSSNSYLAPRYGEAAVMARIPDYVIASSDNRITKIEIVAGQTFPELAVYGF